MQGFFDPRSISWRVDREVALLAGGTCALLMQLAHPAVAAGVEQHSDFRADPFARLRRTLHSSLSIVFHDLPDAERSVARVNAVHRRVRGIVPESDAAYAATEPRLLLWVHATLIDTALRVYDRFVEPLSADEMEAYHEEAKEIAVRLGIPRGEIPKALSDLRAEMRRAVHDGDVGVSPTARRVARRVLYPSPMPPRFVWDAVNLVSFSLLPPALRRAYGIPWNARRERAVDRLAASSRRVLPFVPPVLRYVPQARSAERRLRVAMMAGP
ncbi:MAG: oxygenase MpaB family protein [Candidatus Limnocylindria bacterium]